MNDRWTPLNTSTYQDHVIAHVVGATALGYLILDQTAYIDLEIQRLHAGVNIKEEMNWLKPLNCEIVAVEFYLHDEERLLLIKGESNNLEVSTSLATGEIIVHETS